MSGFFVAGGTMKPGAESYIPRRADAELYEAVKKAEYCTVLTTRQMGKSSLMARTAARLREEGIACATVDLQGKGGDAPPPEQWYYGVVKQIADGLHLPGDWPAWWKQQDQLLPSQRMTDFFADIVLNQIEGPVVVFIDEVDWMIRLKFSDEFFAAIRSCFNRRAIDPAFDRLTFVLLGSAAPAQLIKDATRTPFNVGRGIELTDFTPEEAAPLAAPLGENGGGTLARVLHWTDGHPYLTQMLCAKAAEEPAKPVDTLVQENLLSTAAREKENNLKFVGDRLTQGTRKLRNVLQVYRDILRGKPVKDIPASPIHTSLRLSGAVKPDPDRILRVRNRIYERVFNERWVREKMPIDIRVAIGVPAFAGVLGVFAFWYLVVFPKPYIEALETASKDEQVAYNAFGALNRPLHHAKAADLLAQFFERRGDRDSAILIRTRAGDARKSAALVGNDYPLLERTFRFGGEVYSLAFSPHGDRLAAGSEDKTARIFEVATGKPLHRFALSGEVTGVAFSPDGSLLACGSWDNRFRVFDAATGNVRRVLDGGSFQISQSPAVSFSPDGRFLLATGVRRSAVYLADSDHILAALGKAESAVFSSDAKLVAAWSSDGTVVIDVPSGRVLFQLRPGMRGIAFIAGGRELMVVTKDGHLNSFEVPSGNLLHSRATGFPVGNAAFDPASQTLALTSGGTLHILGLRAGEPSHTFHSAGALRAVAFSPDGKRIAAVSYNDSVYLVDAPTGAESGRLFSQGVSLAVFSPDSKHIAAAARDGTVRVFGLGQSPSPVRPVDREVSEPLAFSPDGRLAATRSAAGGVRVIDTTTGKEKRQFGVPDAEDPVALSDTGAVVATRAGLTAVYESSTGRLIPQEKYVEALAISPDGKLFGVVAGKRLKLFETATSQPVTDLSATSSTFNSPSVTFAPDGKRLALAYADSTTEFDAATGRQMWQSSLQKYRRINLILNFTTRTLAFNPDGTLLATSVHTDETDSGRPRREGRLLQDEVRILDASNGREIWAASFQREVPALAFSHDGELLVVQAGNWLHYFARSGVRWRPLANRWLPVVWPGKLQFVPPEVRCNRCVWMFRDVPENPAQLERFDFENYPPAQKTSAEWSDRLGLAFDVDGRIVPLARGPAQ